MKIFHTRFRYGSTYSLSATKQFLFLGILLFLICLSACNKPDNTPSSGYYFYCKIDGKEFMPTYKAELGYKNIVAKLLRNDSSLIINADIGNERISFGVNDGSVIAIKRYKLLQNRNPPGSASYKPTISIDLYETDSIHMGEVIITDLDRAKMLVKGTFYFDAYDITKNNSVHVTDGAFSLYYDIH